MARYYQSGLLTNQQRPKITDEDLPHQLRFDSSRTDRIRKQLRQAILQDPQILYNHYEPLNLDIAFKSQHVDRGDWDWGLSNLIALVYRIAFVNNLPFGPLLQKGILRAEKDMHDRSVGVDFAVEPNEEIEQTIAEASEKVESREVKEMNVGEMQDLLETIAYADIDVAEVAWQGWNERVEQTSADGFQMHYTEKSGDGVRLRESLGLNEDG